MAVIAVTILVHGARLHCLPRLDLSDDRHIRRTQNAERATAPHVTVHEGHVLIVFIRSSLLSVETQGVTRLVEI